jgi:predicted DCC family thiol-disulfide oxidoreductase YuxK
MRDTNRPLPPSTCDALTVMFDGACPLCRREVELYRSLKPLETVAWMDVSEASAMLSPQDQARYMARFHVRQKDGRLLSGAAAFVALWLLMPGWRWLGKIGSLPGVTPLLELLYRGFLRIRPYIQRLVRAVDEYRQP